ncbi:tetratricopeptide repeat protein [Pontibacter sp. G13]|uniref:tetratricopeptide repeat protein n=1 Tax=Pontibacter sp. G13 TaxID=3074898 RepID=UPI00288A6A1E|nr:tetratricopeptide repeat protein [Pontibacter sp. G13]WNJ16582.1 tetratricopeptide repeat protein [Pontibacter sp. G13]
MSNRLEQLLEFLRMDPNDPFNLYSVAYEYMQQQDIGQAQAYFLKLRQSHPDYVGTYYHLGKLYQQQDLLDEAIEVFKAGIQVAQQQKDTHSESELKRALQSAEDEAWL